VTDTLRQALEALLAAPRSTDCHGYLHYVDPDLLEAVEEAYRQEKEPFTPSCSTSSQTPRRQTLWELMRPRLEYNYGQSPDADQAT